MKIICSYGSLLLLNNGPLNNVPIYDHSKSYHIFLMCLRLMTFFFFDGCVQVSLGQRASHDLHCVKVATKIAKHSSCSWGLSRILLYVCVTSLLWRLTPASVFLVFSGRCDCSSGPSPINSIWCRRRYLGRSFALLKRQSWRCLRGPSGMSWTTPEACSVCLM